MSKASTIAPLRLLSFTALCLALLLPGYATSQNLPDPESVQDYEKSTIVVFPEHNPIILSLNAPHLEGTLSSEAIDQAIRHHFEAQPYLSLLNNDSIITLIKGTPTIATKLSDANNALKLGEQFFFAYSLESAAASLRAAIEDFATALGEITAPDDFARATQFLSYTMLELIEAQKDNTKLPDYIAEAQDVMRRFVQLAPTFVLDPDRQPPTRVVLFRETRRAYLSNLALRRLPKARFQQLAQYIKADYIAFTKLVQDPEGVISFELEVYDTKRDEVSLQVSEIDQTHPDNITQEITDLVDATLSRFSSCVTPKPAPPKIEDTLAGRFFFDTSFSYFVFIESPTSNPFDNMGASFRAAYMFNDYLMLSSKFMLAFSGSDQEGDLQSLFNTFRWKLSTGLTYSWTWVRPFITVGIELAKPTDFVTTNDLTCKVFDVDDPFCDPSKVHRFDVPSLVGLTSSLGVNFGLEPLYFFAEGSVSGYVFPFGREKRPQLPPRLGLGHRIPLLDRLDGFDEVEP